jgi:L-lactate dehydrogenase complex protein LldG
MTARDSILSRIREALRVPAPLPGAGHGHGDGHPSLSAPTPHAAASGAREWLPPVGHGFEEQAGAFAANAAELKAEFHLLESPGTLGAHLQKLRDAEGWTRIASHAGALADPACQALGLPALRTDRPYDVTDLEACQAGLSECDALVAQTGSVLVTNRSAGGRALSVLPPHHVVLARRDQLVPDLPAAFELLQHKYAGDYPSFITFITGPSRTGDIERILVLGAHGPKKLTIFLV